MADALERENRRLADENAQLHERNAALTSLCVAASGLLAAADAAEALATLQDIIINLVGCEQFAVFNVDARDGQLGLAGAAGLEPSRLADVGRGGIVALSLADGTPRLAPFSDPPGPGEAELTACVPLTLDGKPRALVLLFELLGHKRSFTLVDRELFELLNLYAARALVRDEVR